MKQLTNLAYYAKGNFVIYTGRLILLGYCQRGSLRFAGHVAMNGGKQVHLRTEKELEG
jgi:hypothetical protein